jgi:hypothetical protein
MDWQALLISLFFALGCWPLAFFQANCPCCGGATCAHCDTGTMPNQVQIVVSGIANASCATCASLNGTFILTARAPIGGNCAWQLVISEVCGPSGFTSITMQLGGTGLNIDFGHAFLQNVRFSDGTSPEIDDCQSWSSFSVAKGTTGTVCTNAAATCLLTTL